MVTCTLFYKNATIRRGVVTLSFALPNVELNDKELRKYAQAYWKWPSQMEVRN
jgi:hypothetical protein